MMDDDSSKDSSSYKFSSANLKKKKGRKLKVKPLPAAHEQQEAIRYHDSNDNIGDDNDDDGSVPPVATHAGLTPLPQQGVKPPTSNIHTSKVVALATPSIASAASRNKSDNSVQKYIQMFNRPTQSSVPPPSPPVLVPSDTSNSSHNSSSPQPRSGGSKLHGSTFSSSSASVSASSADRAAGPADTTLEAKEEEEVQPQPQQPPLERRRSHDNRPWQKEYTRSKSQDRSMMKRQGGGGGNSSSLSRSLHSSSGDSIRSMQSALSGTSGEVSIGDRSSSSSGTATGSVAASSSRDESLSQEDSDDDDDDDEEDNRGVYNRYRRYLHKDDDSKTDPRVQNDEFKRSSVKLPAPPQLDYTYRYQGEKDAVPMNHRSQEQLSSVATTTDTAMAAGETKSLKSTQSNKHQGLHSDKLPEEDLKLLGAFLLGHDDTDHSRLSMNDDSTYGDSQSFRSTDRSSRIATREAVRSSTMTKTTTAEAATAVATSTAMVVEEEEEEEEDSNGDSGKIEVNHSRDSMDLGDTNDYSDGEHHAFVDPTSTDDDDEKNNESEHSEDGISRPLPATSSRAIDMTGAIYAAWGLVDEDDSNDDNGDDSYVDENDASDEDGSFIEITDDDDASDINEMELVEEEIIEMEIQDLDDEVSLEEEVIEVEAVKRNAWGDEAIEDIENETPRKMDTEKAVVAAGLMTAAVVAAGDEENDESSYVSKVDSNGGENYVDRSGSSPMAQQARSLPVAKVPPPMQRSADNEEESDEEDLEEFLNKATGSRNRIPERDGEESDDFSALWQKTVQQEENTPPPSMRGLNDSYNSQGSSRNSRSSRQMSGNNNDDSQSLEHSTDQENQSGTTPLYNRHRGSPTAMDGQDTSERSLDAAQLHSASVPTRELAEHDDEEESMGSDFKRPHLSARKDDDSIGSDQFSLKASQEFSRDDLHSLHSIAERPEYDHRLSKKNFYEERMNKNIQDLDTSVSLHDVESISSGEKPIESPPEKHQLHSTSEESPIFKPTASSGVWRNVVRGSAILLVAAAIGVPLYFVLRDNEGSGNSSPGNSTDVGPIIPPIPTIAPTLPLQPVVPPTGSPTLPTPSPPPVSTDAPQQGPTSSPVEATFAPDGGTTADEFRLFLISQWPSLEDDLSESDTPQFFAFDWLLNDPDFLEYDDARLLQRFTLATLYFSTDGENWQRNDRWLSEENECLWYTGSSSLPCDDDLFYTAVDLDLNNLSGTIPSELALLSNSLTRLDLSGNFEGLTGSIPSALGFLTPLQSVNLGSNSLQGSIPDALGNWNNIQSIDLSDNQLTATLPVSIGIWTDLSLLNLENNQLEGSLPTTVGSLTSLRTLNLADNAFSGPVPGTLGESATRLEDILIARNRFTSLPDEIGNLVLLRQLSAEGNELAGTIPPGIGNLVNLLNLNLSRNRLTGPLPTQIGQLASVRDELNLSQNNLSGTLPDELGDLVSLRNLLLNANALTGPVPETFSNLVRINTLRLEDNDLTGTVPQEVCDVYSESFPIFVTDCLDSSQVECDCCMFCCEGGGGACECQYTGTVFEILCDDFVESPGLEERLSLNVFENYN